MQDYKKIDYTKNKDVVLRYIPGHFITPNSHVNYYMDLTDMKSRQREARATGEELADLYLASEVIDTIMCLNGMEVVGAYMANKLTKACKAILLLPLRSRSRHASPWWVPIYCSPCGRLPPTRQSYHSPGACHMLRPVLQRASRAARSHR